jgi:ABC-2 type transport system permease protein
MQNLCLLLPLTHFNNAMREIAFEGSGLSGVAIPIFVLLTWCLIVYVVAIKVFKWE